jgi:hypothetical protein
MPNLERRRNLWYAVLVVPTDVRASLGKFKFIQSLGTPDKRKAQALAAPVVAKWRAVIRRERGEPRTLCAGATFKHCARSRAIEAGRDGDSPNQARVSRESTSPHLAGIQPEAFGPRGARRVGADCRITGGSRSARTREVSL